MSIDVLYLHKLLTALDELQPGQKLSVKPFVDEGEEKFKLYCNYLSELGLLTIQASPIHLTAKGKDFCSIALQEETWDNILHVSEKYNSFPLSVIVDALFSKAKSIYLNIL